MHESAEPRGAVTLYDMLTREVSLFRDFFDRQCNFHDAPLRRLSSSLRKSLTTGDYDAPSAAMEANLLSHIPFNLLNSP